MGASGCPDGRLPWPAVGSGRDPRLAKTRCAWRSARGSASQHISAFVGRVIAAFLRRRLNCSLADELAAETFLQAFDARARDDLDRLDARNPG